MYPIPYILSKEIYNIFLPTFNSTLLIYFTGIQGMCAWAASGGKDIQCSLSTLLPDVPEAHHHCGQEFVAGRKPQRESAREQPWGRQEAHKTSRPCQAL